MTSMTSNPGMSQGKGGLSQGKGGGGSSGLPKHAGGMPVVGGPGSPSTKGPIGQSLGMAHAGPAGGPSAGIHSGMLGRGSSDLAALFGANQGYGGGGSGVSLPQITQPTRESMGLPDITKMLSPRAPVQPVAPPPRAPTGQEVQQRVAQVTPGSEVTYGGGMGGSVNPLIGGTMGAPAVFAQQYEMAKRTNPAYAAQMLERSPFKSLFAPVQGAAPQQPFQRSQASLMADEINRMAAGRR